MILIGERQESTGRRLAPALWLWLRASVTGPFRSSAFAQVGQGALQLGPDLRAVNRNRPGADSRSTISAPRPRTGTGSTAPGATLSAAPMACPLHPTETGRSSSCAGPCSGKASKVAKTGGPPEPRPEVDGPDMTAAGIGRPIRCTRPELPWQHAFRQESATVPSTAASAPAGATDAAAA